MYSKKQQLAKNKSSNPKKMSKADYKKKCDWLFRKYSMCQICTINKAQDAHHCLFGRFGADKDDRTVIAICRECHDMIHHNKTDIVELHGYKAMRHNLEKLGFKNHEEWENEKFNSN